MNIPKIQYAVQLVGPDELKLNTEKSVPQPGPHQILCKVEAVGLCFSDLKLLKQFTGHVRKSEVISGIDPKVLDEIPSYVPGEKPGVPGHEACVRVIAVGDAVRHFQPGQRFIVQADYRWLPTENANGAFGYNFEGALQEYVLLDERVIFSPQGQSTLIPVSEKISASAAALVEPWACVEDAYVAKERRTLKAGGQMLVVAEKAVDAKTLETLFEEYGKPGQITWIGDGAIADAKTADSIESLRDAAYDDVLYFGSQTETVEKLFPKVAQRGFLNIVLCGGRFEREVETQVGRVHYGAIRIIGTTGSDPSESMTYIPDHGEIREGEIVNVVGAAGPMGVMHVIRDICEGVKDVTIYAGDIDDHRLADLTKIAAPLAEKHGVKYISYNSKSGSPDQPCSYIAIMAPIPQLVAAAVKQAADKAFINIFAGIPATVTTMMDLNACVEKRLYFIGTSGSVIDDMKKVLAKVESGQLDTNLSAAAVCGIDHAVEGIRAVENRSIAGKIVVYPQCKGLKLTELKHLNEILPAVAAALNNGQWTRQAEQKLIESVQ